MKRNLFMSGLVSMTLAVSGQNQTQKVTSSTQNAISHTLTTSSTQKKPILDTSIRNMDIEDIKYSMLSCINQLRKKHKLRPYQLIESDIAQKHSQYLFDTKSDDHINRIDHIGKDSTSPYDRVQLSGIDCSHASENICSTESVVTIRKAVEDLRFNSKNHRLNLLSKHYTHIIVGHYPGSNNIVVDFIDMKNKK